MLLVLPAPAKCPAKCLPPILRGIKNRMEFFRRALGHYLTHLGAEDAAALFTNPSAASA